MTVDKTVPKILFLSTSIPDATANFGLSPTVFNAIPVLLLEKSQTRAQQKKKKSSRPVGI